MRAILPADAPIREWGWPGDVILLLAFPALVYGAFAFYSSPLGAGMAARTRHRRQETK
jgi:hypothetical protein